MVINPPLEEAQRRAGRSTSRPEERRTSTSSPPRPTSTPDQPRTMSSNPAPRPTVPEAAMQRAQASAQRPGPAPAPQSTPYATLSNFGPGQDLRATQIAPQFQPQHTDRAAQLIEMAQVPASGFQPGAQARAARSATMNSLESLQGPDRAELAARAFELARERTQPQYQQDLRDVGERAAALGRVGAGMTTNELTDVFTQRERDLGQLRESLALQAAQQQLADRLNVLGATSGVAGQLRGEDLAGAVFERQGDVARAGLNLDRAGALVGLDNLNFGRGVQMRDELRGERGFQQGQADRAIDNSARQALLEDQLTGSSFNRDMMMLSELLRTGFGYDPTNALLGASDQASASASNAGNSAAQLFLLDAMRRRAAGGGGGVPLTTTTGDDILGGGFA